MSELKRVQYPVLNNQAYLISTFWQASALVARICSRITSLQFLLLSGFITKNFCSFCIFFRCFGFVPGHLSRTSGEFLGTFRYFSLRTVPNYLRTTDNQKIRARSAVCSLVLGFFFIPTGRRRASLKTKGNLSAFVLLRHIDFVWHFPSRSQPHQFFVHYPEHLHILLILVLLHSTNPYYESNL